MSIFLVAEETCDSEEYCHAQNPKTDAEMLEILQNSLQEMVTGVFGRADEDSDGILDVEESENFRVFLETILEEIRVGIIDPNGDGLVTFEEALEATQRDFNKMISLKMARDRGLLQEEPPIEPKIVNRDGVVIHW